MPQPQSPKGERRLLSLLFSDLVGSMELAGALDPEDLREVYRETREIAFAAVEKFGGRVKDYIGDGVVAYFGYPTALERGAQAAVNAALEMVGEVARRAWPVAERAGCRVRMRVGVHTGEVVVGPIGDAGGAHEPEAVVGSAPILAHRAQCSAPSNSVAITGDTHRLVAGQFRFRALAPIVLPGSAAPVPLHEVLAPEPVREQVERIATRPLRPLVGRAGEYYRLLAAWRLASEGCHRGVCLEGEAGIGKSRLMVELKSRLREEPRARVWEFQCSPYHTATPYFAVKEVLREKVCYFTEGETGAARVSKLAELLRLHGFADPRDLWLLAELLGLPYPEAELSAALAPEARKRALVELLAALFAALAEGAPALYEFNDAHWMDASTAEWLAYFRTRAAARSLFAVTTRPDAPGLAAAVEGMEKIALAGLADADVERLARSVAGGRILPHEVVSHIARTSAGVPLFVEELTAALLASGAMEEREHHYELRDWNPARQPPFSLRDLLQGRLDRLAPGDRAVAHLCAAIGTEVTPRIVSRVLDGTSEEGAAQAMQRLADAGILERNPGRQSYEMRHALIRNAAYETVLKSSRARYHLRVAEMLLAGEFDGVQAAPSLVAEHYTLAGMLEPAAPLWLVAAQQALRHSAHGEATALARRGLEVVAQAGQPLALREVQIFLCTTLGMALVASKGFASPEAAVVFKEAERLLAGVEDPTRLFPAMWGLCITHLMRGELDPALDYATRMLAIGRVVPGGALLIEALWMRGAVLFWLGRLDEAESHLIEAVRTYRPEHHANAHIFGQDPGVAARVYLMQLLSFRLRPDEAAACAGECLTLAESLRHPHSLAWAMASATMVKLHLGDVAGTLESGQRAAEHCMKQEHPFWLSAMKMLTGWAAMRQGRAAEGLRIARDGFALYEQLGTSLICPFFCAILAECCAAAGDAAEAAAWVGRGKEMVDKNNEQLSKPGVLLMAGQLAQRAGPAHFAEAESYYREALVCARGQGSRLPAAHASAALASLPVPTPSYSAK